MRCAIASSRLLLPRLVEQLVKLVPRADFLLAGHRGTEHLTEATKLPDEIRTSAEVDQVEHATTFEGGSSGLPERATLLRADCLSPGQRVETTGPRHRADDPLPQRALASGGTRSSAAEDPYFSARRSAVALMPAPSPHRIISWSFAI